MADFYRRFLRDGLGWLRSGGPRVYLAAFGKHPGWNDHMDDLGLAPQPAVRKRILTSKASWQPATGAWEQLDESARLPSFNHLSAGSAAVSLAVSVFARRQGTRALSMIVYPILGLPAPPADRRECSADLRQQCRDCSD